MPPSVYLTYPTHTTNAHADRGRTFGKPPAGGMSWMGGKPLGRMLMATVLLAWSVDCVRGTFCEFFSSVILEIYGFQIP